MTEETTQEQQPNQEQPQQPSPAPRPRVMQRPVRPAETVGAAPQSEAVTQPTPGVGDAIEKLKVSGSGSEKMAITTLSNYAEEMDPKKPMSVAVGGVKQRQLFFMIKTLLDDAPINDFTAAWRLVIYYFKTYPAFSWENIFRFIPPDVGANQLSPQQAEAFRKIVNLIRCSGDPKLANNVRQHVDLNKTAKGFGRDALTKLAAYYR